MGFRTVVILNNDASWDKDPKLGEKIQQNMMRSGQFDGGNVAECVHTSQTSLLLVDYLSATEVSYETVPDRLKARLLDKLREAADRLGYTLRKKRTKKKQEKPEVLPDPDSMLGDPGDR